MTRAYDAAFILFLGMELPGLEKEMRKAAELLKESIKGLERFDQREYRNPLWHCSILNDYGRFSRDKEALSCSLKPLETILSGRTSLLPEYEEVNHEGPGKHDFFSSWGLTLHYLSTVSPRKALEVQKPDITNWYRKRKRDEYAFNLSTCWGLGKFYQVTGKPWALEAFFDIWDEIPSEPGKGLPRQKDFPVPESWASFFQTYACLSLEKD